MDRRNIADRMRKIQTKNRYKNMTSKELKQQLISAEQTLNALRQRKESLNNQISEAVGQLNFQSGKVSLLNELIATQTLNERKDAIEKCKQPLTPPTLLEPNDGTESDTDAPEGDNSVDGSEERGNKLEVVEGSN